MHSEQPRTAVPDETVRRVLIAEDDEALSIVLQYNLGRCGAQVETIADGAAADGRLHDFRPDLVILDWGLPALSGIEVLRRLRSRGGPRYVPVIMLTARSERESRLRAVASGADIYLTKPFALAELMAHARRLLFARGTSV